MTHHTDAERAAFEAAIRATMHDAGEDHIAERLERWPDGAYKDRATGYAWWGYQKAARRAPAAPVPQVTPEMIEAALEAYMPFGDMELAIQCALSAAPQPPEAAPVELPEPVGVMAPWPLDPSRDYIEWANESPARGTALYTEQQVRALLTASKVERKPLTDEAIRTLYGESDGHWQMVGPQVLCFARSIESVHGIQEQST